MEIGMALHLKLAFLIGGAGLFLGCVATRSRKERLGFRRSFAEDPFDSMLPWERRWLYTGVTLMLVAGCIALFGGGFGQ